VYHQAPLFVEMRVSLTFCPVWPWTVTFQISTSRVAKITGVSHLQVQPRCSMAPTSYTTTCCHFGQVPVFLHRRISFGFFSPLHSATFRSRVILKPTSTDLSKRRLCGKALVIKQWFTNVSIH
jgi:hypothetical protein